jgi:ABC-type antimicrobial peptide transport system permease subunit
MVEPRGSSGGLIAAVIYIPTDGSLAAENRARTRAANLAPNAIINSDRDPIDYSLETFFSDFDRLGRVAALFVLIVGAFGLAAAMIGGLLERRRPFALLHASGVRVGELRRAVLLETTATMVLTSLVGAALGLVLAFNSSRQTNVDWRWPGADVYGSVAGGVLAALLFSTLALPLLSLATRHEAIRYE